MKNNVIDKVSILDMAFTKKEIDEILQKCITCKVDTREQIWYSHIGKFWDSKGIKWRKEKLDYGDYSFEVVYGDIVESFDTRIVIERKANLDELTNNYTIGRDRLMREFGKALKDNCIIKLIIEDEKMYQKMLEGDYRSCMTSNSLRGSLMGWSDKYNIHWLPINRKYTPILIYDTFYYYLRNRLMKNKLTKKR